MLDRECTLFRFVMHYAKLQVQDLDDARMAEIPAPGLNHAAWILGHLCIANDYGLWLLGKDRHCPKRWSLAVGMGTKVVPDRAAYPSKTELWDAFEASQAKLMLAANHGPEEQLAKPNPLEPLKPMLPTVGDIVAHLMTTHPCIHLGQLSAWRRLLGLPPVLGF